MRLSATAHTSRPWRIHELTPDFRLEDVWALSTPGGPGDLPRLVAQFASGDFPRDAPLVVRVLWEARWRIGALLGWDRPEAGLGARATTLRDRLPPDLRDAPAPGLEPFTPLYLLEDEYAAELANRTVHTVIHLGWVPDESGGYRGQMAVLVKPNGRFGTAYMAAIKPLRYLFVVPALLRTIERGWQCNRGGRKPSPVSVVMDSRDFRFKQVADVRAGHHAAVLSSTWATPRRCWSSTRLATARRAPEPLGSSARTPAPCPGQASCLGGPAPKLTATPARMSIREA